MKYKPVIGLEIHVQLKTKRKMFCNCSADYRKSEPNTHTCPVCLGLPGALPMMNKRAIEYVIQMGLALNCKINKYSYFSRKNYFYPDLPKGFQTSQYDNPFCYEGQIKLFLEEGIKEVGITRVHLEEDTGKSMHEGDYTLLDFNKSGVPLMEIVTEPDFDSSEGIWFFAKKIRQLVRYLEISDGDMEKGMLRIEPNISLLSEGQTGLPDYKVEIKNLNSFTALRRGVEYEIERQRELLEKGETPTQETRGWDDKTQKTFSQRSKEESHDYRYFPEADLPPIVIKEERIGKNEDGIFLNELKDCLPELPDQKVERFKSEYGLTDYDAQVLTDEKSLAKWFEEAVDGDLKLGKKLANWVITEIMGRLQSSGLEIDRLKFEAKELKRLVELVEEGKISRSSGKEILNLIWENGGQVEEILKEKGLEQVSDMGELEKIVLKVIAENPGPVSQYKEGKTTVLQFLIGMVMRETKGKADVKIVRPILEEKLK